MAFLLMCGLGLGLWWSSRAHTYDDFINRALFVEGLLVLAAWLAWG